MPRPRLPARVRDAGGVGRDPNGGWRWRHRERGGTGLGASCEGTPKQASVCPCLVRHRSRRASPRSLPTRLQCRRRAWEGHEGCARGRARSQGMGRPGSAAVPAAAGRGKGMRDAPGDGRGPRGWGAWERPHETRHAASVALGRWARVFVYFVCFVVPTLRGVESPRMASLLAPSAAGRRHRPRMQPVRTPGFVEPRNTRSTRKRGPSRSCGPCPWAGVLVGRPWSTVYPTRR